MYVGYVYFTLLYEMIHFSPLLHGLLIKLGMIGTGSSRAPFRARVIMKTEISINCIASLMSAPSLHQVRFEGDFPRGRGDWRMNRFIFFIYLITFGLIWLLLGVVLCRDTLVYWLLGAFSFYSQLRFSPVNMYTFGFLVLWCFPFLPWKTCKKSCLFTFEKRERFYGHFDNYT